MRRAARRLVTLRTWPDIDATCRDTSQLALLGILWLQRQVKLHAIEGRQGSLHCELWPAIQ
jgi:hypothetical protein